MSAPASLPRKLRHAGSSDWTQAIDRAIIAAEEAELELSRQGAHAPAEQRKASGSYYTPSDVAGHFWDLFFRHHRISDLASLLAFTSSNDLVEPSAGSGMFVFSFLRKAASLGATPDSLGSLRFHVIDINLSALRFFAEQMRQIEAAVGVRFVGVGPSQNDFLEWTKTTHIENAVFVGNPPFITNPRGHSWRNLYADFVAAMLQYRSVKGVSLILPLSVCFSRDYAALRDMIRNARMGISASSYDNIPDCLFKAGKPDSTNTNRANSQRCTILNLGGPDPDVREASALLSWSARERGAVLSSVPDFRPIQDSDQTGQLPRPASDALSSYMESAKGARPLRAMLSKIGRPVFAVGGVARNYIGIRDIDMPGPGSIPIKAASEDERGIILQILSSALFYDYWRTYGDGFHVTVDLIERFPVTQDLMERFARNLVHARQIWADRAAYAKEKLNSGRVVRSYDFRTVFE
ncbi:hypothetical protein [Sphingomonas sp. DC1100-1]|uniref:hypothetical protein n=1 Tax=unclassified Sphingomonas TaxID=196159 RepID=UPI003CF0B5DC